MTARDDIEAVAAGVLAEHEIHFTAEILPQAKCSCDGWWGAALTIDGVEDQHRAHVATVLTEALAAMVAGVRAEALREAADEVRDVRENGLQVESDVPLYAFSHPTAEHFEDWLRARAEAVAEQGGGSK